MAIDPSISLQGRGIDITPPNPIATLMSVAQLKQMQTQQQMHQLQMAEMAARMQEYQAISAPGGPLDQMRRARQGAGPRMVSGEQLNTLPPGGGAMPGMVSGEQLGTLPPGGGAIPQTPIVGPDVQRSGVGTPRQVAPWVGQAETVPPSMPFQETYASDNLATPVRPGTPLPWGRGAVLPQGTPYQMAPQAMQPPVINAAPSPVAADVAPMRQGMPAPPQEPGTVQAAPGGAPPQEPGAPGTTGAAPQRQAQLGSGEESARQYAVIKQMIWDNPRIGPAVAKPLIEIDQQLLAQQKGQLEFQSTAMGLIAQGAAAVQAQPDEVRAETYAQWRQVLIQRGIPGVAQQLPEQYDPARVQALGTQARTAKDRIDQQLTAHQQEIDAYGKETERFGKDIEQARLGDVEWRQDASGAWFPTSKTPGARTGRLGGGGAGGAGGVGAPAIDPTTRQPYKSMEAQQRQVEQEQSLGSAFRERIKPYVAVRDAYNQVQTASTPNPTNPMASDTALLDGFQAMLQASGGHLKPEERRSWLEQVQKWRENVTQNGALVEPQRKGLLDQAAKVYRAAEQVYEQELATSREQTRGMVNVRPHIVAPDIRANTRPYTAADVAAGVAELNAGGTRQVTPAQYEQYLQSKGRRKGD